MKICNIPLNTIFFEGECQLSLTTEQPSELEYQNAIENLTKHDYKVDYIIMHCCPDSIQNKINPYYSHDKLTNFLEAFVKEKCDYKHWFFGHYHEDLEIDSKHTCLYHRIIKIK